MGEKDTAEKSLFCFNDVFSGICNGIIYKGVQKIKPEELSDATSSSSYRFGEKLHSQERDVAKYWKDGEIRLALLGIENQTDYDPDMPLRIMSYDAAAYRAQLAEQKDGEYTGARYPVVTFVLNFSTEERWKNKSLFDRVKVSQDLLPFVSNYTINVIDLAWLDEAAANCFHGEMRFIIDYLSAVRQDSDFKPSNEVVRHYDELMQVIAALGGMRLEDTVNLFTQEEKEKGEIPMSGVFERMFEKERNKARAEGRSAGFADGRNAGILEGRSAGFLECSLNTARNMRKDGMPDSEIIRYTGLPLSALENL